MAIKKYLRLILINTRLYLIYSLTYRVSFLIELAVELGYSVAFTLFYVVIFQQVKSIGGWNYDQTLFFIGLNIVASELLVGFVFADKIFNLPENIKNGKVDFWLLKPVHPLFTALMPPYTTAFVAAIPGVYIMFLATQSASFHLDPLSYFFAVVVFFCGMFIAGCVSIIISLLAFVFINANSLPNIATKVVFEFTAYPHTIYQGLLKGLFFILVPLVYATSVPTSFIFNGVYWPHLFAAIILAVLFGKLTVIIWNQMIRRYSSASS